MKLIIDIDERAYKACMNLRNNDDMGLLGCHLVNATANGTPPEEELESIKAKIDFEEKWLTDIKMNNGFISIADIEVAMSGIRSVITELKGEKE